MSQRHAYEVTLEGVDALDMPLSLLRDLCDLLVEGTQRATRLSVEGRSVVGGKVPAWLASAVDLRVGRYERGSLSLAVSAPELHVIAPELFSHPQPFSDVLPPDATALDVFLGAADDAIAGRRDSERLDAGVLEVLTRASSLLSRGATRLSIGRTGQQRRITVDTVSAQHIQTLAETTPTPRVDRVTGVLDALTVSTRALVLRLDAGKVLRGLAVGTTLETLKALLGHRVVIEGAVTFRPSGDALRIEVDHAALATAGDELWARVPHVDVGSARLTLPPSAPALKDLFGHWPGDETEDVLFQALEQMS